MTENDLLAICGGARKAGAKLILGLNLNNRNEDGSWNSTNSEALVEFVRRHGLEMDFELGNEPNSYHHKFNASMSPDEQLEAQKHLLQLLRKELG